MLEGDEWKDGPKSEPKPEPEPKPDEPMSELSSTDVEDHSLQLKMLYAQQRKSNWLPHGLTEQCAARSVHTFY